MAIQTVFERKEMKYLLTPMQYRLLRNALKNHMLEDEYGLHTICSIYFDTDDNRIIRHSLNKPVYKEKLRLRSYGIPKSESAQVFLELKKKFKGIVYKRRIAMPLSAAERYIHNDVQPEESQIFKEIDYYKKFYQAYPKVFIAYDRIALYSKDAKDLRMTFDFNIRCRRDNLSLKNGDYGEKIIADGYSILEIKILKSQPKWLSDILSDLKIYPTSFSKYGEFYKSEQKGEKIICSQVS